MFLPGQIVASRSAGCSGGRLPTGTAARQITCSAPSGQAALPLSAMLTDWVLMRRKRERGHIEIDPVRQIHIRHARFADPDLRRQRTVRNPARQRCYRLPTLLSIVARRRNSAGFVPRTRQSDLVRKILVQHFPLAIDNLRQEYRVGPLVLGRAK